MKMRQALSRCDPANPCPRIYEGGAPKGREEFHVSEADVVKAMIHGRDPFVATPPL